MTGSLHRKRPRFRIIVNPQCLNGALARVIFTRWNTAEQDKAFKPLARSSKVEASQTLVWNHSSNYDLKHLLPPLSLIKTYRIYDPDLSVCRNSHGYHDISSNLSDHSSKQVWICLVSRSITLDFLHWPLQPRMPLPTIKLLSHRPQKILCLSSHPPKPLVSLQKDTVDSNNYQSLRTPLLNQLTKSWRDDRCPQ